ncbi:hypothetical protein LAUMK4_05898 [Mycobacterium persicum]|uniref:PE family immunomodulator PE35 n=1 Tax=Mycobacterium persicum TaxID=1487726 RepID=A0ABY6RSQ9_9MYCO|nr:hypothetical protein [Mycobacterium persicum]VBA33184.1 hypothetical protein LAUMK4_05898 [Mycobacterium persicum]
MESGDVLQVTASAAETANTVTGSATAEFAVIVPEQSAHGVAASAAGAAHAVSMWGASVAASATVRQQVAGAAAALAPHGGIVAQRNEQALTEVVETDTHNAQDLTCYPVVNI